MDKRLILMALLNIAFLGSKAQTDPAESLYDVQIKSLAGEEIDLAAFKGKKILFVNVASECGFTPQYAELQDLHKTFKDQLVIIGVPCNQFGGQEPGNAEQIQSFCSANYGVEFLITEKADVKGENQHPLYSWLTRQELNGAKSTSVKWNFQKYMVDEEGRFIDFWYSMTSPKSSKITSKLNK
jgi:glutathione peroxidase